MTRKTLRFAMRLTGIGAITIFFGYLAAHHLTSWASYDGPINRLAIDLRRPDGLIVTQSLAKLPRDLLRVPLLKDLLSEDFVFYYERGEDRLGLVGSLRRIAYEHDLKLHDRLIDRALDEPAELAFWRDAKGSAEYTLLAMTRNGLARLIQGLASVAMKDRQLTLAAEIAVGDESLPVYALSYGRDRTLLVVSRGNRVVVLSDPGMLLRSSLEPEDAGKPDPIAVDVLARLLAKEGKEQEIFRSAFALPETPAAHRIAVSAGFLSFGYQHFFPDLKSVRFDFADKQWTTHLRLAGGVDRAFPPSPTLQAMPARAAACAWVPVSWPDVAKVVTRVADAPPPPALTGPGSVCWYGISELQTPVFAAELAGEPKAGIDDEIGRLFAWAVVGEDENAKDENAEAPAATVFQRRNAKTNYVPSLGRRGKLVVFSPDFDLVQRALDTLDRRYPSVADTLPADTGLATVAVLTPKSVGELARQAIFDVLPQAGQPALHDAAAHHLPARLATLEKYPAYRLALSRSGPVEEGWHPVRWDALPEKP